jgi:hypothetical protein
METKRFFTVEARHPNIRETIERKVFSAKKEALKLTGQIPKCWSSKGYDSAKEKKRW